MFEVPESDIIGVKVDHEVILGKKPVEYVRAPKVEEVKEQNNEDSIESELNDEGKAKTYA
jgi:hypothetical protein